MDHTGGVAAVFTAGMGMPLVMPLSTATLLIPIDLMQHFFKSITNLNKNFEMHPSLSEMKLELTYPALPKYLFSPKSVFPLSHPKLKFHYI